MALEENIAEKVARLNRLSPARDVYDLVWVASRYGLLGDPDEHDQRLLACGAGDRRTIIAALQALPGTRFADVALW